MKKTSKQLSIYQALIGIQLRSIPSEVNKFLMRNASAMKLSMQDVEAIQELSIVESKRLIAVFENRQVDPKETQKAES